MVNQRKDAVSERRSEKMSGGNFGFLYFYRKGIFSSVPQNDCSC